MVVTGLYFLVPAAALGALCLWLGWTAAAVPLLLFAAFCGWFFRDPEREVPGGPVAVSPADGKVVRIRTRPDRTEMSIFLNVFDVHVNRTPIAGRIVDISYTPGKFLVASKEEAMLENERNSLTVEAPDGTRVQFAQVAGLIARRIECWKSVGDDLAAGERIGLIRFGSRVDLIFGPEWEVQVKEGDRVAAAASVLARRKGQA